MWIQCSICWHSMPCQVIDKVGCSACPSPLTTLARSGQGYKPLLCPRYMPPQCIVVSTGHTAVSESPLCHPTVTCIQHCTLQLRWPVQTECKFITSYLCPHNFLVGRRKTTYTEGKPPGLCSSKCSAIRLHLPQKLFAIATEPCAQLPYGSSQHSTCSER